DPTDGGGVARHLVARDRGCGIPPGRRHAIFEACTQAGRSTARTHGGTGLGLTISSRLAELMGGRLWLESEVGRGSTFHVTLRCRLAPPRAEPRVASLAGLAVLVAEPNPAHRTVLVDRLAACVVTTAHAE